MVCSTPFVSAPVYRSSLRLRLRVARRRTASGWASTTSKILGVSRITYVPQHEAGRVIFGWLFPPLLLAMIPKMLWWDLLSVPAAMMDDPG